MEIVGYKERDYLIDSFIECIRLILWLVWSYLCILRAIVRVFFRSKHKVHSLRSNVMCISSESLPVHKDNLRIPRISSVSCKEDRACELIHDLLESEKVLYINKFNHSTSKKAVKPPGFIPWLIEYACKCYSGNNVRNVKMPSLNKKMSVIAQGAEGVTLNQLLIYLHENNVAYILDKTRQGKQLSILEKEIMLKVLDKTNPRYKKHFPTIFREPAVKSSGLPSSSQNVAHLSPEIFDKIVYISSPMSGIEWINDGFGLDQHTFTYKRFSLMWFIAFIIAFYYKLVGDTNGYIPSPLLGHYSSRIEKFIDEGRNIAQDLANVNDISAKTEEALEIIKMYNISTMRVVTKSSVEIGGKHYIKPVVGIKWYVMWLLGARFFKKENDGLVSVESQAYGLKCSCINEHYSNETTMCNKCNTIICPVNHGQFCNKSTQCTETNKAWNYITEFID